MIKLFRRLVDGVHPEAEMVRALTERGFTGIAALMGEVRYKNAAAAVVQRFVENQGDAFQWSLEQVGRLIDDKAVTDGENGNDLEAYRNFITVAGRRLGEMHTVLAEPSDDPDFMPEKATAETVAAWRERLRVQLDAAFALRDLGDRKVLDAAAERPWPKGRGCCSRASMATCISARSSWRRAMRSSSISRASRPGRSPSAAPRTRPCAMSPACCARSTMSAAWWRATTGW